MPSPRRGSSRSSPAPLRRDGQAAGPERLRRQTSPGQLVTWPWQRWRADDQHTLILGHIGTLGQPVHLRIKAALRPGPDSGRSSLLAKVPSLYLVWPGAAGQQPEGVHRLACEPRQAEPRLGGQRQRRATWRWNTWKMAMRPSSRTCPLAHWPVADRPDGGWLDRRSGGALAVMQFIKALRAGCIIPVAQRLAQLPDRPPWPSRALALR